MFEWIKLFPPYLIFLTAVFVIIPTIASLFIRFSIYRHLNDLANKVIRLLRIEESRGIQPKIVEELEIRYKVATSQLEQVNTSALIDGVYSQEKFSVFGFSLRCEQWDYFCRILPNLLLAFGLLGTFLGITTNLYNLSQTINSIDNDVNSLVQQLQTPLQSMGIAFITSLVALLCSSFLIVINLRCNTNLAKYRLISSLEDYLDNIFKPVIQGDSRLDKAVNRMVEQQHEFLTRFHEKVGQVMELTLGRAALKIAEENEIANSLAREVYERFLESSGTLAKSTATFKDAALLLDGQIQNFINAVPHLNTLENSALIFQEASKKIERSKFSENLENLTADLAKTQREFATSTSLLGDNVVNIIESNQKATDLAAQVYSQLQESSTKLQDSAVGFIEASEKIENSQFADKLLTATTNLANIQNRFSQSAVSLESSTQLIEKALIELENSAQGIVYLGDSIENLNQRSANLIELTEIRIEKEREKLAQVWTQINVLIENIDKNEQKINLELQKLGDRFVSNAEKQLGNNSKEAQKQIEKFEKYLKEMGETKSNLSNLVNALKENTKLMESKFQFWGERLTTAIERESKYSNEQMQELLVKLERFINVPTQSPKLNGQFNHKNVRS
jgi:hypothetical protein